MSSGSYSLEIARRVTTPSADPCRDDGARLIAVDGDASSGLAIGRSGVPTLEAVRPRDVASMTACAPLAEHLDQALLLLDECVDAGGLAVEVVGDGALLLSGAAGSERSERSAREVLTLVADPERLAMAAARCAVERVVQEPACRRFEPSRRRTVDVSMVTLAEPRSDRRRDLRIAAHPATMTTVSPESCESARPSRGPRSLDPDVESDPARPSSDIRSCGARISHVRRCLGLASHAVADRETPPAAARVRRPRPVVTAPPPAAGRGSWRPASPGRRRSRRAGGVGRTCRSGG